MHRINQPKRGPTRNTDGSPVGTAISIGNPFVSIPYSVVANEVALDPGTQLGIFTIRQRIGAGLVGSVYLADGDARHPQVAIKIVDIGSLAVEARMDALAREMARYEEIRDFRHVLKVHDPHIIPFQGTHLLLLPMEYADGGTFRQWLERYRSDLQIRRSQGLEYFKMACHGVAALHAAGLVHKDIKPENLLFVGGTLRVSDFGITALVHDWQMMGWHRNASHTPSVAFTPAYMSPEHARAESASQLDARSDVYSLCLLLYELWHPQGHLPFHGSHEHLWHQHLTAAVPPLPDADAAVAHVVGKGLRKEPSQRYQTVEEMLRDLQEGPAESLDGPEDIWQQICEYRNKRSFDAALRLCDQLLEQYPRHQEATVLREELQVRRERAGQLYAAIDRRFSAFALDELGELLLEATETYPDHPARIATHVRLEVSARQYRKAMEMAVAAVRQANWQDATAWLEKAEQANPGSSHVTAARQFIARITGQIQEQRRYIDRAIQAGRRSRAMRLARQLDEYVERITSAIETPGEQP